MKKALGCMGAAIECLLFLWLLIGLWACANKIRELEDCQKEYMAANSHVETSDNKLLLVAMRCQKMEQDNDMLRLRIEELEDAISAVTNDVPKVKSDPASWVPPVVAAMPEAPLVPLTQEEHVPAVDDLLEDGDYVD